MSRLTGYSPVIGEPDNHNKDLKMFVKINRRSLKKENNGVQNQQSETM